MKRLKSLMQLALLSVLIIISFGGCALLFTREILLSDSVPEVNKTREAKILTAFFGLDNGLTQRARAIYINAPGKDGMPLVFSHELDPNTLQAADFTVTSQNGTVYKVEAVSFLPANEEFELRTVLLIGEYGNHPDNPPVSVQIVGDLIARSGQNFKGKTVKVIPLKEGPVLSYAEYYTIDEKYPYKESGAGCDCPKETKMVVKAVWSGGVRALNGKELGDNEKDSFIVTMVNGLDTFKVTPYKLADLGDSDNNIDLCIKQTGIPIFLEVKENVAIDPNNDKNPKTEIEVVNRW
jgi:hypothetical protein